MEVHGFKLITCVGILDQKPIPGAPKISTYKTSSLQSLTCDYFISVQMIFLQLLLTSFRLIECLPVSIQIVISLN